MAILGFEETMMVFTRDLNSYNFRRGLSFIYTFFIVVKYTEHKMYYLNHF